MLIYFLCVEIGWMSDSLALKWRGFMNSVENPFLKFRKATVVLHVEYSSKCPKLSPFAGVPIDLFTSKFLFSTKKS